MASIFIRTVLIYLLLSCILKIMGKRQIGELEVSELVSTLLISEIAAIPIDDPDIPLFNAVLPILFILSAEILISAFKNRSARLKHLIEGEPIYIIYKGNLRQRILEENRISINEVLSELRVQGVADIADVYYAILEQNGKISVIERSECRPLCPKMLSSPGEDGIAHPLIIDGEVHKKNLEALGYSEAWLTRLLRERKTDAESTFLLTVNDRGEIREIPKEKNAGRRKKEKRRKQHP